MKKLLILLLCLPLLAVAAETRVSFTGEITPRSLDSLEQKVQKAVRGLKAGDPRAIILDLDSGGGNLFATLSFVDRIQRTAASQNFTLVTRVRSSCESSCTVLFTAGSVRQATRSADFGFHSPAIASRLPRGMSRKVVLQNARDRWLAAVARVDGPLSYELDRRGYLLREAMSYMSGRDLLGGYVSELVR